MDENKHSSSIDSVGESKRVITEFMKNSTGHGLPRIVDEKSVFGKIMWTIFLLTSIVICALMIIRCFNAYFEYDVTTKITVENDAEMVFPVISICNVNQFIHPNSIDYIKAYYRNSFFGVELNSSEDLIYLSKIGSAPSNDFDRIFYQTFDPGFDLNLKKSFGIR